MKTVAICILAGALVGVIVASYVVPPALSWYSAPGGLPQGAQIQAVVQIPEVIRYATGKLLRGQTIGGGVGAWAGKMWRIGCMGHTARPRNVAMLLGALGEITGR